ncbi:MAG: MFS transporter [Burkholderiales bacterium]|jgi:MFS family permease|nr:MFS transporter [Burkholderiales bacterium]
MSLPPVYLQGRTATRVVLVFGLAYFLSYAMRAINAVIAPALSADLQLSNADLGLLSAAYFMGFGMMQLPIGVWLDRHGPRRTESALLLFGAVGAAIFACSHTLLGVWVGRALIGVGVSSCLMAAFKAFRVWYPAERQSQLGSWMLVIGTSGALSATVPVAMLLPLIGWRNIFFGVAGALLLAAWVLFSRLRDVEQAMSAAHTKPVSSTTAADPAANTSASDEPGYAAIFSDPYFRRMALLGAVHQGGFMALQSLWAGPWMMTVLGMSIEQTSHVLFLFNLSLLIAYLGLSWWAPRYVAYGQRRGLPALRVVAIGLSLSVLLQGLMVLLPYPQSWWLWVPFAVVITVTTLGQTHVSLAFPTALVGRANSAFNLTLFVGAFSLQWGIGLLLDWFVALGWRNADAMRMAFACYVLLQVFTLWQFLRQWSIEAPSIQLNKP